MMTLKEMVKEMINKGITEFRISYFAYDGRYFVQTEKTVEDFIKGYEDCIVVEYQWGQYSTVGDHDRIRYFMHSVLIKYALPEEFKNFITTID